MMKVLFSRLLNFAQRLYAAVNQTEATGTDVQQCFEPLNHFDTHCDIVHQLSGNMGCKLFDRFQFGMIVLTLA